MGKQLNIGIVGCGDIAGYSALVCRLIPQIRLAACCDVDRSRVEQFAHRHNIPARFLDYEKMLDSSRLDAVYIAVPHFLHYPILQNVITRNIPALVEKPFTRTIAEGMRLANEIGLKNLKVGVNYQYRYDAGAYGLARAVQAGKLGKIYNVRINVPWHRDQSYFEKAPWHCTIEKAGGGTLLTQGSHFLDIALWALGEKPATAMGYTASPKFSVEVETLAEGIIQTEKETMIQITSSMVSKKEKEVTIEVYGESGNAYYRNLSMPHLRFDGVNVRREPPPVWGVHALQRSLAGFARWILADQPYLTPAKDSLPVLAVVEAIYRSAKSGMRENINDGWD